MELGRVSATPLVPETLTFLQYFIPGPFPLTVRSRTNIGKVTSEVVIYTKYFPSSLVQSYPQRTTNYISLGVFRITTAEDIWNFTSNARKAGRASVEDINLRFTRHQAFQVKYKRTDKTSQDKPSILQDSQTYKVQTKTRDIQSKFHGPVLV